MRETKPVSGYDVMITLVLEKDISYPVPHSCNILCGDFQDLGLAALKHFDCFHRCTN
jgi:hypothetical protein